MNDTLQATANQAWERMPDEPSDWYTRFAIYLALGHTRSIVAAYRAEQADLLDTDTKKDQDYLAREGAPKSWYEASKTYDWIVRASAYDDSIVLALLDNEDELRRVAKAKRIDVALAILSKVGDAIKAKASESIQKESANALSQASKQAAQILREDLEGHSTSTRTQIEVVLKELPPELAQLLASYVKK